MTDGSGAAGLLLAAGGGTRLGRPKALVEWRGRLLVEHAAAVLAEADLHPRVVVLGAAADEIVRQADLCGGEVVVNDDWRRGMAGSFRAGLDALDGRAGCVVITLVDQPLVGPEAIRCLLDAWHAGARAAVATYDGRPRNPVLLDASLWPEVRATAKADAGARNFLRAHPDVVTAVSCDALAAPTDVDTPEDLAKLRLEQPCS